MKSPSKNPLRPLPWSWPLVSRGRRASVPGMHLGCNGHYHFSLEMSKMEQSPGELAWPGCQLQSLYFSIRRFPHPQLSLATRGEDWASQGQPKGNFILTGTHTKPGLRGLTLVPPLFSLFWGDG